MTLSIRQQTEEILTELPPEGLSELVRFIEFLRFKYLGSTPVQATAKPASPPDIPADSLTAQYQGFVQSPLTVAELSTAYEFSLTDDQEE